MAIQCSETRFIITYYDQFKLVPERVKMNWSVYFKVVLIFQEVLAIDLKHFKEMKQLVN